jgi:proteasome accessory factor B
MLRIHERLAAERYPNCSALAVEFEVSPKTVQRDIDFMRDQMLLPIDYDQMRHGFRYTKPVGQFPMLTVSAGELVALLVAQKAVEQYRGTAFEKPLRTAFGKLASSMEGETRVSIQALGEAVSFRPSGVPVAELRAFETLAEAVMDGRIVEFDYRSMRARTTERRRVEPYHLSCIDNQWYLIAFDQVRGARRTFALSRLTRVKALKRTFRKPPSFSASAMLAHSFSAFEAAQAAVVRLRFDPLGARLVGERRWHRTQKMQPLPDGGAELTMKVGLAPDLTKWLLGWGPHVRILEPASLRDEVRDLHRQAAGV